MTISWHNRTTIARRLQVRGSQLDPILTQLRLRSLLGSMDAYPAGLAPSAILCIRTLRDPLPGTLQLHHQRPSQAWQQAVIASLDALARRATRPVRGPIPANAEAVIFADRAELLACLACDWCEGTIIRHWWWQSLFTGRDIIHSVLPIWLDTPEYIPAALHHLTVRKKAVSFVRALSDNDVLVILHSIIHSFALHHLAEVLIKERFFPAHQKPPPPPWQQWTPESADPGLRPEQQFLLGTGLMLRYAPTIIRTAGFAHTVSCWYQTVQDARVSLPVETLSVDIPALTQNIATTLPSMTSSPPAASGRGEHWDTAPDPRQGATPTSHSQIDKALAQNTSSVMRQAVMTPDESRHIHKARYNAAMQGKDTLYEAKIETALGGVFYLINLGLSLNLYGDFTTPLQPGIPLNIWDFVVLVGLQLLGEKIQSDPLWGLLAQLAGRDEHETPGQDFSAFHPPCSSTSEIAHWLSWLMPSLLARLSHALDLTGRDDLPHVLCEHHARVLVTATHVDIFLSLAELPIAIRLAGLDRNPGWVPAAGRFIAFHFE